jgi:hypothetical protein
MTGITMTDTEVENFAARRDAGELMCNYMSQVKYYFPKRRGTLKWNLHRYPKPPYKYTITPYAYPLKWIVLGTDRTTWPFGATTVGGRAIVGANTLTSFNGWPSPMSINGSLETSVTMTALSARLAAGISSILVSLAEADKTVSMLVKALKIVTKPLTTARQILRFSRQDLRDPVKRKQVFDTASDIWLEGRYGWRPLFYDYMSYAELAKATYNHRQTVRSTDIPYDFMGNTALVRNAVLYGELGCYVDYTPYYKAKVRYGQTADFTISSESIGFIKNLGGLDPLGTVWDLIPYSFVVDWFINLGDVLQATQAYALIDERVGWATCEATLDIKVKSQPYGTTWFNPGEGRLYELELLEGTELDFEYSELVVHKFRNPVDTFLPSIGAGSGLNSLKILDGIALLRNILKR